MGLSNAERQARHRAKQAAKMEALRNGAAPSQGAEIEALRKRVRELETALAANAEAAPLSDVSHRELSGKLMHAQFEIHRLSRELEEAHKAEPERIAALSQRIRALEQERARRNSASKAARTRTAKAALDPDSAAASEIKGLRTRIKTLQGQLEHANKKHARMSFETKSMIAKALHPDASPSPKDREEAFKAFSGWKADDDAVRRQ
ncbi:hypothetical protein [Bradyrhizobium sp. 613_E4_N2_2]|uniref:hypothetical protein n=1 Tax=Bradyrhizobium sp. 613_E4_N2_2 TaxID=3240371 RepID=UPI003F89C0F1